MEPQDDYNPTDESRANQVDAWLSKYQKLIRYEKKLRSISEQQLERADGLKGMDYTKPVVKSSPTPDAVPNAAIRHMEISEQYDRLADEAAALASKMKDAITSVSDIDGRTALLGFYVEGNTWESLCVEMSRSYSTMMRLRRRSLVEIYERDLIPHTERYPRVPAI